MGDEALRFVGTRCSEARALGSGKELEEDIPGDWCEALIGKHRKRK